MNNTQIKLVFFDLGNVLVNVHIERFYQGMAQLANISELQVIELTHNHAPAVYDFNCGRITAPEFYKIVCQDFDHVSQKQFTAVYTDIFSLNKETTRLARALKKQVRISIISNTDELHFGHILQQFPEIGLFENPVLSYEVKAAKPAPEIYYQALCMVNFKPEQCIFIDDLQENVIAANKIGIHGMVYTTPDNLIQQLSSYNLHIEHSNSIGGF